MLQVTDLFWSPNTDILTIIYKDSTTSQMTLELWVEHNNNMYLKQTFFFSNNNPLLYASWNKKMGNELILLSLKEITICSFNWCINHSKGKTVKDQAMVVAINGSYLFVTSLRKAILPPPRAHQVVDTSIYTRTPINAIAFAPDDKSISTNAFCAISSNDILIYKQNQVNTLYINTLRIL